jgi:tetrahydromethanopterin S-methyltransferase subunit G
MSRNKILVLEKEIEELKKDIEKIERKVYNGGSK